MILTITGKGNQKYLLMNNVINDIEKANVVDGCESFIHESVINSENPDELSEEISNGFLEINTTHGAMELDLNNGRLEFEGTSMGGSSEFYWACKNIYEKLAA